MILFDGIAGRGGTAHLHINGQENQQIFPIVEFRQFIRNVTALTHCVSARFGLRGS